MPSVGPDAVTAMQPDYKTPRQWLSGPVLSPNAGKGGAGCPRLGQMQSQPCNLTIRLLDDGSAGQCCPQMQGKEERDALGWARCSHSHAT